MGQGDVGQYIALEHVESWTGRIRSTTTDMPYDSQLKRFRANDVLFGKLRPYLAKVARPINDGVCVGEFLVLRTNTEQITSHYLECLLRSKPIIDAINSSTYGARMPRADWQFIGSLCIPIPSIQEQVAISRFLDHADRKIRRYIRAKQKLIKLLEEQKQAIIHRAVTLGLDPDVPLKPSGIDWLGDIPAHWQVLRLKAITSHVTSGSRGWSNYQADDGALFIRIGNLRRGSIGLNLDEVIRLALPHDALSEARRTLVQANDILLSITAYIGSVAVVPDGLGEAYVSQHVACCRLRPMAANPRWIGYVLVSEIGKTHGRLSMNGGTKQGLSLDDVRNHIVLVPPPAEQTRIVDYLDSALSAFDTVVRELDTNIRRIQEFRDRLISDVVTGKLDVREAAAKLTDEVGDDDAADEVDLDDQSSEIEDMEVPEDVAS